MIVIITIIITIIFIITTLVSMLQCLWFVFLLCCWLLMNIFAHLPQDKYPGLVCMSFMLVRGSDAKTRRQAIYYIQHLFHCLCLCLCRRRGTDVRWNNKTSSYTAFVQYIPARSLLQHFYKYMSEVIWQLTSRFVAVSTTFAITITVNGKESHIASTQGWLYLLEGQQ